MQKVANVREQPITSEMKKIMFSEKYGLTQAVLDGRKTMTRRMVPLLLYNQTDWKAVEEGDYEAVVDGDGYYHDIRRCGKYQIGEEVAVAQRYKDVIRIANSDESVWQFLVEKGLMQSGGAIDIRLCTCAGYDNKMFVAAGLMPHRIRITDIKVERLQDISEEDCMKEGIMEYYPYIDRNPEDKLKTYRFRDKKSKYGYYQLYLARDCFAVLIDRISGKGTWERNPWCFAYEFELIK